jgi:hypothetical protein
MKLSEHPKNLTADFENQRRYSDEESKTNTGD